MAETSPLAAGLPHLTYLSFDPVGHGVGASQVLPYVTRLAKHGLNVELHSFEPSASPALQARLDAAGVRWTAHRFGDAGTRGGLARVARGAAAVRGAPLVHARAHLAAAAAILGRSQRWIWDVRSLWTEERIVMGTLRRGSLTERTLLRLERRAAAASNAVVTLSRAAIPALEARTGWAIGPKARVISTCVDLDRFAPAPPPDAPPVRLLLSGSLNALYDVPAMIRLADAVGRVRPAALEWVGAEGSPWETMVGAAGVRREERSFDEMPDRVSQSHAGLCLQRPEAASGSVAAAPTKVAEFLACGRPVVVSAGLGDFPVLLQEHGAGVVVGDTGEQSLDDAARQLCDLLEDPGLGARCRRLAEEAFDLDAAVDALLDVYASVISDGRR